LGGFSPSSPDARQGITLC